MDWSNSAQNYPYQYNPQQENAALTAIGSGLRIDAAIKYIYPPSPFPPFPPPPPPRPPQQSSPKPLVTG